MAKAKKSKTKKSRLKKPLKTAKKAVKKKKPAKAKAPARAVKKKAVAKKTVKAKKAAPKKKKKQIVGEGDYAASRAFLKDQAGFVKRNEARISALGKAAEKALEGPEGADLLAAEAAARSHSKAGHEE